MNKLSVRGIVLLLLAYFAFGGMSYADDPASSLPPLDPFSRPVEQAPIEAPPARKSSRVATRIADDAVPEEEGSGFKWPTLPKPKLPKLSFPAWTTEREMPRERPRHVDEPSTWEKVSSGTKNLLTKTKQTLMPWSQEETMSPAHKSMQPPRRTPPKSAARTKAKSASNEKKSFFSWFSKKEEEKPVQTVNDFLAQPRIQ